MKSSRESRWRRAPFRCPVFADISRAAQRPARTTVLATEIRPGEGVGFQLPAL